jgi:hypothetical protein
MKIWMVGAIAAVFAMALFVLPGTGRPSTAYAADYCGVEGVLDVPDSGATFDFTDACAAHDACYAQGGTEADRRSCDQQFLEDMLQSCSDAWPNQWFKRHACDSVAYTYYLGVHLGGWAFFPYGQHS